MPKINARQRILAYLQSHNAATALELSRALRVTPANIRYHLSILVADGRAKIVGERRGQGRGRPVQAYGLGDLALGDNLPGLADALLSDWLEKCTTEQQEAVLLALAVRLASVPVSERTGPFTRRLSQAIERLNVLRYRSRWEAHAQGPRVVFDHCPYAAIVGKHPELCRMDALLLQELLGTKTTQIAKLEPNLRGASYCMFELE